MAERWEAVTISRRDWTLLGAFLAAAMLLHGSAAWAEEAVSAFPSHYIKIIVPFAPGGPPDILFRFLAPSLGETLGKPVLIENRPGRSTALAATDVAHSPPDGYTLLACDVSFVVAPEILVAPGFDPVKDFRHVGLAATSVLALVASPTLSATNVKDLVALAKREPDEFKVAHSGAGSGPHLGAIAFMQATGTKMTLVPYRGAGQAINDIAGGYVSLLFTTPSTAIGFAQDGKVRLLGVTGKARLASLPDVPTLAESGVEMKGLGDGVWFGLSAPAATPAAIVAKLNMALYSVLADKDVRDKLSKLGFTAQGGSPDQLTRQIETQSVFWRDAMREAGVKPE